MKLKAVRNIRLCTKDCLCLYVCPTGATDTETGQIDASKCIGCGVCANACPSHAISLVPYEYPEQQEKEDNVKEAMLDLTSDKKDSENIALNMISNAKTDIERKLLKAISLSNKYMAEDIVREASFLLPQGKYTIDLLEELLDMNLADLPADDIGQLINLLKSSKL